MGKQGHSIHFKHHRASRHLAYVGRAQRRRRSPAHNKVAPFQVVVPQLRLNPVAPSRRSGGFEPQNPKPLHFQLVSGAWNFEFLWSLELGAFHLSRNDAVEKRPPIGN
jgi:hypothetical protein